ncbi:hypothetical protein [Mesorhizobium sp. M0898]|uniref:hypothetical protein n=1 Tax=Mesorhizobium sp. M0898 TaxID=2957020 RepID=UPI0033372B98
MQTLYLVPMIWAPAGRFYDAGEVANPPPMHDPVILRLVKETGITVEQARDLINLLGNLNWNSLLREGDRHSVTDIEILKAPQNPLVLTAVASACHEVTT